MMIVMADNQDSSMYYSPKPKYWLYHKYNVDSQETFLLTLRTHLKRGRGKENVRQLYFETSIG
jgi:hypothetical protein